MCGSIVYRAFVQCCFTCTENVRTIRVGEPGTSTATFTVLMLKCCFTSTETVCLLGTGAQDGHLDFHTPPELWKFHSDDNDVERHVLGCRLTY